MKIASDSVKRLREEKSWSQDHLATVAGVSLRTAQRVESDGAASAETRMALASALEVPVSDLIPKPSQHARYSTEHKLGLAFGIIGATAGLLSGWFDIASSGMTGQEAGTAYGTMGLLTGVSYAAIGIISNRLQRTQGP